MFVAGDIAVDATGDVHPGIGGRSAAGLLIRWAEVIRALIALVACLAVSDGCATPERRRIDQVAINQIAVVGQPVQVWADTTQIYNGIDASARAWREADGTVNLLINSLDAYRMRGPDLDHLTFDPNRISIAGPFDLVEAHRNFWNFIMGPYSLDGVTFYSLSHSEQYAYLIASPPDGTFNTATRQFGPSTPLNQAEFKSFGRSAFFNSWTTTVNLMRSTNGGATFAPVATDGSQAVADTSFYWTGTPQLANRAYMHAVLYTGIQQISRLVKEGSYYYAVGNHYHRDFTGTLQYPLPGLDKNGLCIIRTQDFTNPSGWEVWTGGSNWASPITRDNVGTFLPMVNGVPVAWTPNPYQFPGPAWAPDIIFDTVAHQFILMFTHGTPSARGPVGYITSPSLATPVWSDYRHIIGSDTIVVGPGRGFSGPNYVSMIDPNSPGFNFEYTNGNPRLYYVTGRNLYQLQLQTTYGGIPQTGRYLPGAEEANRVCAAKADEASRPSAEGRRGAC